MSFPKASSPPLPPRTGVAAPKRRSLMGLENRNHTRGFVAHSGVSGLAVRLQSLHLVVSARVGLPPLFSTTVDSEQAECL